MEDRRNEPTIESTENEDRTERMDAVSTPGTIPPCHAESTDDLLSIWESASKHNHENAFEQTISFLKNEVEELVSLGVDAFHRSEKGARELKALREELKSKDEELERTRLSEEKSRTTVAVSLNMCVCAKRGILCVDTQRTHSNTHSRNVLNRISSMHSKYPVSAPAKMLAPPWSKPNCVPM